eukprot:4819319-Amphidinium_carterae.1
MLPGRASLICFWAHPAFAGVVLYFTRWQRQHVLLDFIQLTHACKMIEMMRSVKVKDTIEDPIFSK